MNQDKINFTSDDLQKTMEVPAVDGKDSPAGEVFDPWHLDTSGPPDSVIDYIAKSLSGADKMPEIITVSTQPDEEVAEEISPPKQPETKADDTAEVKLDLIDEKPAESVSDETKVLPVVSPESDDKIPPVKEKKEVIRQKATGGRIWPPVVISSVFMIVACIVTLTLAIIPVLMEHGFTKGMTQIMAPVISAGEPPAYTNVLLVGVDKDGYRTDTMMVATYDVENKKVSVMQLPRDTYVANNGRIDKKLNSAYYLGIKQLQEEVQIAYGIEIHKYVEVNLEAFRKMIDAIGGVETVVPFNMIYDDPTQDFHIYLLAKKDANGNPLPQLLDGKKAEQFVRFRKNNDGSGYAMGDLQRMQAQKQFLMDAVKQMISIDGLKNINELIEIAQENVDTDLTFDEIYNYCTAILTAEEGAIEFVDAPGEAITLPFGSYFIVEYDAARNVATERFYATAATMAKMKRIVVQPVEPEAEDEEEEEADDTPNRPSRPTGTGTSTAVTRPDDDEPEDSGNQDTGSGAMSR